MKTLVEDRCRSLSSRAYSELLKMPVYQEERIVLNGRKVTLATWKQAVGADEIRVIVQAYRHLFLGVGRMEAKGFDMKRSGEVKYLARRDIYEYT